MSDSGRVFVVEGELPSVAGAPGLAQGSYGDVGNLELVVPDPQAGLWVFWFNADELEHRAGAAVGCWNAGLHVSGPRVTSTRITQLRAGPAFLEVVAVTADRSLRRWFWTPDDGFVDGGLLHDDMRAGGGVLELELDRLPALAVDAVDVTGRVVHLQAALDGYPAAQWIAHPIGFDTAVATVESARVDGAPVAVVVDEHGAASRLRLGPTASTTSTASTAPAVPTVSTVPLPGRWSRAVPVAAGVIGLDRDGQVQWADEHGVRPLWPGVRADEITAADTSLDGGRTDVVLRTPQGLQHGWGRHETWTAPRPIVSRVWVS